MAKTGIKQSKRSLDERVAFIEYSKVKDVIDITVDRMLDLQHNLKKNVIGSYDCFMQEFMKIFDFKHVLPYSDDQHFLAQLNYDLTRQMQTQVQGALEQQIQAQKEQITNLRHDLMSFKHFAPPPINNTIAERIVNLLNEQAREKYDFYSDHFKKLVAKENSLLALHMAWHDSPSGFSWEKQQSMALTQAFLRTDTGEFQCSDCHQFYLNPVVYGPLHQKICQGKQAFNVQVLFTLDLLQNGSYICHYGCDMTKLYESKDALAQHFYTIHNSKELANWHIKTYNLELALGYSPTQPIDEYQPMIQATHHPGQQITQMHAQDHQNTPVFAHAPQHTSILHQQPHNESSYTAAIHQQSRHHQLPDFTQNLQQFNNSIIHGSFQQPQQFELSHNPSVILPQAMLAPQICASLENPEEQDGSSEGDHTGVLDPIVKMIANKVGGTGKKKKKKTKSLLSGIPQIQNNQDALNAEITSEMNADSALKKRRRKKQY